MDLDDYLSLDQAAERLGVSERLLRLRIKDGSLRATKWRGRILIEPAALAEYQANRPKPRGPGRPKSSE